MNITTVGKIFLFISVVAIAFGIACFSLYTTPYTTDSEIYGGDAYTGIQNAAADTANNIFYLMKNVNTISGLFFMLIGIIFGSFGIYFTKSNEENNASQADSDNNSSSSEPYSDNSTTQNN